MPISAGCPAITISPDFQLRGAWVSATGRLATEHHRISTVPDGVLQVRHFGTGRDGLPQRLDSWDLLGLAGGPVEVRRLRRNSQKMRRKSGGIRGNSQLLLGKFCQNRLQASSGMLVQSAKCGQWQCWQDTQSCSPPSVWHWSPEIKTQQWPHWWDLLAYLGYFKVGPLWDLNMSRANEGQNATTCYAK